MISRVTPRAKRTPAAGHWAREPREPLGKAPLPRQPAPGAWPWRWAWSARGGFRARGVPGGGCGAGLPPGGGGACGASSLTAPAREFQFETRWRVEAAGAEDCVRGWSGTRPRDEQAREGRCPGKEASGPRGGGRRPDTLQAGSRPRQEARTAIPGGGGGGCWPFSLPPRRGLRRCPRAHAPGPCQSVRLHPGCGGALAASSPSGVAGREPAARVGSAGVVAGGRRTSPTRAAGRAHAGDPSPPLRAVRSGAVGTLSRFLRRVFPPGHQATRPGWLPFLGRWQRRGGNNLDELQGKGLRGRNNGVGGVNVGVPGPLISTPDVCGGR